MNPESPRREMGHRAKRWVFEIRDLVFEGSRMKTELAIFAIDKCRSESGIAQARDPTDRESRLFTSVEYVRKLIENLFNYSQRRAESVFIVNKRDIGFDSRKGPQNCAENRGNLRQKRAKFCQKLAKRWQKMAEYGGFGIRNLIKFVHSGGSSQAVNSRIR